MIHKIHDKKLIIQIPCYNEAETLPVTLKCLPRRIDGFSSVEIVVIDDGSTDATVEVAKSNGVTHLVRLPKNQGLARAFITGIDVCLRLGADVIVNTDADNQYNAEDIISLVNPILAGRVEIAVGARPIREMQDFSFLKKTLQSVGSWVVRVVSRTNITDAPSGFRAFTRDAALRMNIFNEYTYTLETIIQAGQKNMAIESVPVRVNKSLRSSRLVKSIPDYIQKSLITIVRIFVVYKPFIFFVTLGTILILGGMGIGIRFLYYYFAGSGQGHIQSLILGGVFLIAGFQTILVAFLADLLSVNRKLLEDIQYRLRRQEVKKVKE